jgi:hypothetical protein
VGRPSCRDARDVARPITSARKMIEPPSNPTLLSTQADDGLKTFAHDSLNLLYSHQVARPKFSHHCLALNSEGRFHISLMRMRVTV